MDEYGFFSAPERLCVFVSHAIREARVIVDASLHTGRMTNSQAETFLMKQAATSQTLAQAEVLRYKWIPVQAPTYALAKAEILAIREAASQRPDFNLAEFHRQLLSFGPVPPARCAEALLADQ